MPKHLHNIHYSIRVLGQIGFVGNSPRTKDSIERFEQIETLVAQIETVDSTVLICDTVEVDFKRHVRVDAQRIGDTGVILEKTGKLRLLPKNVKFDAIQENRFETSIWFTRQGWHNHFRHRQCCPGEQALDTISVVSKRSSNPLK